MNERIKQLLVAAGEYEMDINDPEFVVPDTLKKFAQLIIRECAGIASMNDDETESAADRRARTIMREIKSHFGVEE